MENCSVDEMTGDNGACHNTMYCKKPGLRNIAELTSDVQELLELHTGISFEMNSTICLHHESIIITRYENLQKSCCDPFQMHVKPIKRSLRAVNIEIAKQLRIKPGQKLCTMCRKKLHENTEQDLSSDEDFDEPSCMVSEKLNKSIAELGCTPIKSVSERDRVSYGKRKVKQVEQAIKGKVAKVLNISSDILENEVDQVAVKPAKILMLS